MSKSLGLGRYIQWAAWAVLFAVVTIFLYLDYKGNSKHFYERLPDHLLAMIGIVAGLVAIYYERKLHSDFEDQKKSMSTRYVGDCPEYLHDIVTLLSESKPKDEIVIQVDLVGYGHLSRHEDFVQYKNVLNRVREEGVEVKMLVYPHERAAAELREEYNNKSKEDMDKFNEFYEKTLGIKVVDFDGLLNGLLFMENQFCHELLFHTSGSPIRVRTLPSEPKPGEVFFWMVRRARRNGKMLPKKMIFAVPAFDHIGNGPGFRTEETKLMETFSIEFDALWDNPNTKEIKWQKGPHPDADLYMDEMKEKQSGQAKADAAAGA